MFFSSLYTVQTSWISSNLRLQLIRDCLQFLPIGGAAHQLSVVNLRSCDTTEKLGQVGSFAAWEGSKLFLPKFKNASGRIGIF